MTERGTRTGSTGGITISPYRRGVGAVALGVLSWTLLCAAALLATLGSPGEWLGRHIPFVSPAWWSPAIVVLLTYVLLPHVIPLMQRLSRCRACGKSTLVTSEHLEEWDVRANPDQRVAGGRRFWPETECSECHADLRATDG